MSKPIKNELQEYFQKQGKGLPTYETKPGKSKGGAPPLWMSILTLPNGEQFSSGYFSRKADAEKEVATKAFDSLIPVLNVGRSSVKMEEKRDEPVERRPPPGFGGVRDGRSQGETSSSNDFEGLLFDLSRNLNVLPTSSFKDGGGSGVRPGSDIIGEACPPPDIFKMYSNLFPVRERVSNPFQVQNNPIQVQNTPIQVQNTPFQVQNNPIQVQNTPIQPVLSSNLQNPFVKRIVVLVDLENKHKIIDKFFEEIGNKRVDFGGILIDIVVYVGKFHHLVDKEIGVPNFYKSVIRVRKVVVGILRKDGVDVGMCMSAGQMLERKEYDKYIVVTGDSFGAALVDLVRVKNDEWEQREAVLVVGVGELVKEVLG